MYVSCTLQIDVESIKCDSAPYGSFHVKSTRLLHGLPQNLTKFGTDILGNDILVHMKFETSKL